MVDLYEGSGPVPPACALPERHPSDDELEMYSMGRVPEKESIAMEEHILVCDRCQDRLREADEFVALMKETTKDIVRRQGEALSESTEGITGQWLRSLWRNPIPVATAAAAVLAIAGGLALFRTNPAGAGASGEVTVELASFRGVESPAVEASKAGSVRLSIDTVGLRPGPLDFALVTSGGNPVWSGSAPSGDGKASVVVPRTLRPGHYFLRASADSALVREFSFEVR